MMTISDNPEAAAWIRSSLSFSNGNCVECAAWRTSSKCESGECASIGQGSAVIGVQDTKEEHLGENRVTLHFSPAAWNDFLSRVKADYAGT